MSIADVKLVVENPEKTRHHRNRYANKSLKLEDTTYRVHKELLGKSKVLEQLMKETDRTLMKLNHLKIDQENFTPCGLNMALDWMYGNRFEFTPEELPDALAAAFALQMYDMVHAVEEAVLTQLEDPFALAILLYHVDNFTPETKKHLIMAAGMKIAEISTVRPFFGCPPLIFKRVIKAANKEVGYSVRALDIAQAILYWTSENDNNELATLLLNELPAEDLQRDEVDVLREIAIDLGLENLATLILSRYYALNTSSVSQRLDYGELDEEEEIAEEQCALREARDDYRMTAGKNVDATSVQDKSHVTEEPAGVALTPTAEDRRLLQNVMSNMVSVNFGSVPLEKSNNDLHIEITYQGPKEAAKKEAVQLYFNVEVDEPTSKET
ncbi:hypothetical protein Y032_0050g1932 [Ancylostoma ceylanicum]|uniref:BTB domain-containing protein n=1 Tax=Ancylostoma ceylanicum TaxID=53326 RepID=A0A016U8J0_9BILA|nr:hypothetical protein Y032_0050g1932 [Ancylostoma ceylanicum]